MKQVVRIHHKLCSPKALTLGSFANARPVQPGGQDPHRMGRDQRDGDAQKRQQDRVTALVALGEAGPPAARYGDVDHVVVRFWAAPTVPVRNESVLVVMGVRRNR